MGALTQVRHNTEMNDCRFDQFIRHSGVNVNALLMYLLGIASEHAYMLNYVGDILMGIADILVFLPIFDKAWILLLMFAK